MPFQRRNNSSKVTNSSPFSSNDGNGNISSGIGGTRKGPRTNPLKKFFFCVSIVLIVFSGLYHNTVKNTNSSLPSDEQQQQEQINSSPLSDPSSHVDSTSTNNDNEQKDNEQKWTWFKGDLNEYYNKLEKEIKNRDPNNLPSIAVHRWMGEKRSTLVHYELIQQSIVKYLLPPQTQDQEEEARKLRVFDAGCGLGSALLWFERENPNWKLLGHTISEEQLKFINERLPAHNFDVNLLSYDHLKQSVDAIYSIEAFIHSPNYKDTLKAWSNQLQSNESDDNDDGVIVIIDDFLSNGANKDEEEVQAFRQSWLANSLVTPLEFADAAAAVGLRVVEDRDLGTEYQIVKLNYRNQVPDVSLLPDHDQKTHQGWLGSKLRQRLMVHGKLTYRMMILQKKNHKPQQTTTVKPQTQKTKDLHCEAVPSMDKDKPNQISIDFPEIEPQLMSGIGKDGGSKMECISGWYCCNKGTQMWDDMEQNRTDNTEFLKLPRHLFGHYMTSFAKHLNEFYQSMPATNSTTTAAKGKFLDIGATGSVAKGMKQVTSKFLHFAGPLDYWILDSDPSTKNLQSNALACDMSDCPSAPNCGFDVTFSHTVLEHTSKPWDAFDTIARITKKGGLTLHLVPFSYQFHATPEDHYRFSHSALTSLMEDRGFTVLDVGYDVCSKPMNMRGRRDEHYDVIWLTYVVARKN